MTLLSLAKLPLSADEGWPELARHRPRITKVFLFLVLPLSLLPPAMLYLAGTHYPEAFFPAMRPRNWAGVAEVCFVAEIASFAALGWLIKQMADTYALSIDYRDAYLLAALTAAPLWLASLGLLIPDLIVNAAIGVLSLGLSCALLFNGLRALGQGREEVVAASIVHVVIGAGLTAWVFVFALTLL